LPPTGRWADRDPAAAVRLTAARAVLREVAGKYALPVENLVEPALLRRVTWSPPEPVTEAAVSAALAAGGARQWQIELVTPPLARALIDPESILAAAEEAALAAAAADADADEDLSEATGSAVPASS
jgi:ribonuclease D